LAKSEGLGQGPERPGFPSTSLVAATLNRTLGGIEQTLIDKMAQAYTLQLRWTARLVQRSEGAAVEDRTKYDGVYCPPSKVDHG